MLLTRGRYDSADGLYIGYLKIAYIWSEGRFYIVGKSFYIV